MKKEELIQKAYEIAVERYAAVGVDTEQVLKTMQDFHLSLHCWQADDGASVLPTTWKNETLSVITARLSERYT